MSSRINAGSGFPGRAERLHFIRMSAAIHSEAVRIPKPGDLDVTISLEHEVAWQDIAPTLDDLQEPTRNGAAFVRVERWNMRPGAGGPGLDILPIAITIVFGPLVAELVKDVVYPKLKERLRELYRGIAGTPRAMEIRPLGLTLREDEIEATYRFPYGLSDADFSSALATIPSHFPMLRAERSGVVLLEYDAISHSWKVLEDATQFLTENAARRKETSE